MRRSLPVLLPVVMCLVLSGVLVLRAAGGSLVTAGTSLDTRLVSELQIARTQPGSPRRVVLTWWRSLQVSDDRTGYAVLSRQQRARKSLAKYAAEVLRRPRSVLGRPVGLEITTRGNNASVVLSAAFGRTRLTTGVAQIQFPLVRERRGWRVNSVETYVGALYNTRTIDASRGG